MKNFTAHHKMLLLAIANGETKFQFLGADGKWEDADEIEALFAIHKDASRGGCREIRIATKEIS